MTMGLYLYKRGQYRSQITIDGVGVEFMQLARQMCPSTSLSHVSIVRVFLNIFNNTALARIVHSLLFRSIIYIIIIGRYACYHCRVRYIVESTIKMAFRKLYQTSYTDVHSMWSLYNSRDFVIVKPYKSNSIVY